MMRDARLKNHERGARRNAHQPSADGRRSARRGRGGKASGKRASHGVSMRQLAAWMPFVGKTLLVVCVAALLFAGYRAVAAAPVFRAARIDVTGAKRASAGGIEATVRKRAAAANVWQLDLDELSREIERQSWVKTAIVSRVLPSGLRVRVTEREPRAVVRTATGQLMWVDEDAVLLARVAPTDDLPPFFLRGYDETLTASAQAENRRRIAEAMKMIDGWRAANVAERVSEVNVGDLRDVRAQLAGRDAEVEVRLGASNYGARLVKALEVLDEERDAPGGRRGARIVRLDATEERRVILGLGNSASVNNTPPASAAPTSEKAAATSPPSAAAAPTERAAGRTNELKRNEPRATQPTNSQSADRLARQAAKQQAMKEEAARKAENVKREAAKREAAKREAAKRETKRRANAEANAATTQRPRRVG